MELQGSRPIDMNTGLPLPGPDDMAEIERLKAMPKWKDYIKDADGNELLAMFSMGADLRMDAELDAIETEIAAEEAVLLDQYRLMPQWTNCLVETKGDLRKAIYLMQSVLKKKGYHERANS